MIMSILSFCLVLSASVDTLYIVDFSTQPPGWVAGPLWQWVDESAYLDIYCYEFYDYVSEEDSLISPIITIIASSDSLEVIFDHKYITHGGGQTSMDMAITTMSLYYKNEIDESYLLWEVVYSVGADSTRGYTGIDSGFVYIPFTGVAVGDTLSFTFRGKVEAEANYDPVGAWLDWNLYSFCIVNYTGVSLDQSTWGKIKASF